MRGKRVKALRRQTGGEPKYVNGIAVFDDLIKHPGRKHGGAIGEDIGDLNSAAQRLGDELSRRAKEMKHLEVDL